jgi:hypothetical protein
MGKKKAQSETGGATVALVEEDAAEAGADAQHSTEEMEQELRRRREAEFQQRVERVLEVMRAERVDWRGLASVTPDGRIVTRVVPVEMTTDTG